MGIKTFIQAGVMAGVFAAGHAYAGKTYFGFELGSLGYDYAKTLLKERGSVFNPGYGYRGDMSLPSIRISADPVFAKYGSFSSGWLDFGPDRRLYQISATWKNAGQTFKVLRDALDGKYVKKDGGCKQWGFDTKCTWQDQNGRVIIRLHRNDFDFQPRVTLTYTWRSALSAVAIQKAHIDRKIKERNAKKAAGDI